MKERGFCTKSCKVVDAPCIEAPPGTLIFVFGAGEEVRDDVREPERTLGKSDIKCPAAEGGALAETVVAAVVVLGNCRASGGSERATVLARAGSGCGLLLAAM